METTKKKMQKKGNHANSKHVRDSRGGVQHTKWGAGVGVSQCLRDTGGSRSRVDGECGGSEEWCPGSARLSV